MAVKKHKSSRKSCYWCGITHSMSQHASHGTGSYSRIHKAKKKAKKKKRK